MNIVSLTSNALVIKICSRAKINYLILAILAIFTFSILTYDLIYFINNDTLLDFKVIFATSIVGLLFIIILFNIINLKREKILTFNKVSSSLSIKEKNLIQTITIANSIDFDDIVDLKIEDKEIGGSSFYRRQGYYVRLVLKSGISPIITSSYIPQNSIDDLESSFFRKREATEEVIEVIRNFVGIVE